ncbi:MAG: hypothetical protein WCF67_08190 [Chitinophagaceae bacterium]
MNINQKIDALKKIKPVEAPPFLFTRIEAKINAGIENSATPQWRLAITACFVLLLMANMYVVFSSRQRNNPAEIATVVSAMNLSNSNSLYDE